MNSRKELGNQALKMAKESSRNKIGTPIVGVPILQAFLNMERSCYENSHDDHEQDC